MTTINLPRWARKPKHRLAVVATNRGWVVQETGELLVSQRNLKQRLELLKPTSKKKEEKVIEQEQSIEEIENIVDTEINNNESAEPESEVETKPKTKPKRKYARRKKKEESKTEE